MFKHLRWLFVTVGVIFFCATWTHVFVNYPPGWTREVLFILNPPFQESQGFEFKATVSPQILGTGIGSDSSGRGLSPLTLWENGCELGRGHAFRSEIQRSGEGAFLHWDDSVYFSSSDNSDPRTNGRTYEVRQRVGLPLILYLGLLLIGYLVAICFLMVLLRSLPERKWAAILLHTATVILSVIAVELTFWVLIENQLTRYGPLLHKVYRQAMSGRLQNLDAPHEPGLSANYLPHHYLNYVLNPQIPYCGTKQFNALYRIRRSEAIEPNKGARWRVLIFGGSTTFGEGITREEDTWPYLLESMVRNHCGPSCDVINSGVGGYTVLENLIHYLVLLKDLSPQVVLLYTGINDVHPRLFGTIGTDYSNYRVPWRVDSTELWRPNQWLQSFYCYRYYFLNKVVLDTIYQGIGGQVSRKGPQPSEWQEALGRNSEAVYRGHLDSLVRLLKSQGIQVGLLPQYFCPVTASDQVFAKGVLEHNRVNEELAREHGLAFGSELLTPGLFHTSDTFDSCHFNEEGSRKMAATVFAFMKRHKLLPQGCAP